MKIGLIYIVYVIMKTKEVYFSQILVIPERPGYPLARRIRDTYQFLPLDAMRKRGLCCRPMSVRLSVCHVGGLYPRG